MKFVSAEWIETPLGTKVIKAIADDGSVHFVPAIDSDVPPWPEFLAEFGEAAIKEPESKGA